MKHLGHKVEDLKIAYIGGGSRGWAWGLMSDLASAEDISGQVLSQQPVSVTKEAFLGLTRYSEVKKSRTSFFDFPFIKPAIASFAGRTPVKIPQEGVIPVSFFPASKNAFPQAICSTETLDPIFPSS